MNRTPNRIRLEIGHRHHGFVQDTGTSNTTFMIRMLLEQAVEMQNTYLCFTYTIVFDII